MRTDDHTESFAEKQSVMVVFARIKLIINIMFAKDQSEPAASLTGTTKS